MEDRFFEKYSRKLHQRSVLAPNGQCVFWTGTLKQVKNINYGVICCKFGSVWKTMYVHRLKFMLENRIPDLDPDDDVSHLCHNSLCMRIDHLSSEPHAVNNNRMACKNRARCSGHGPYRDCLVNLIL